MVELRVLLVSLKYINTLVKDVPGLLSSCLPCTAVILGAYLGQSNCRDQILKAYRHCDFTLAAGDSTYMPIVYYCLISSWHLVDVCTRLLWWPCEPGSHYLRYTVPQDSQRNLRMLCQVADLLKVLWQSQYKQKGRNPRDWCRKQLMTVLWSPAKWQRILMGKECFSSGCWRNSELWLKWKRLNWDS